MTDESSPPSDASEDDTADDDPPDSGPGESNESDHGFEFGATEDADDAEGSTSGEDGASGSDEDAETATGERDGSASDDGETPDDGGATDDGGAADDGETPGDGETPDDEEPLATETGGVVAAARDRLPFPETSRNVLYALVAMTVASLVLRFISLGARVAHQDEGRVGYWIIRYLESGVWEYRAIVHGPFLFHVNKWLFGALGPSDFTARLAVVVIGGTLPLLAWLFRKHLRDSEVIALGFLLALNPVLVYYSRFMRNDVPLAAFMLLALGCAVRYYDTRRYRYVYGFVVAFALGMTTKENGLLYAACWLGAAALLLDHRLFVSRLVDTDRGPLRTALAYVAWVLPVTINRIPGIVRDVFRIDRDDDESKRTGASARDSARWWFSVHWRKLGALVLAVVQFFAVIVFFYAPRGGGYMKVGGGGPPDVREETTDAMGLYMSIDDLLGGDPSMFVAVVEEATVGSWQEFTRVWGGHEHSYVLFARHYVEVMLAGALVVSIFAVLGFLIDRYGTGGPRDLVALASYWGFVSILGYPIATDIRAGWATTHAIVPLAIPAAVGLAVLIRWGVDSYTVDDGVGVALTVIVLFAIVGQMGFAVTTQVYMEPQSPDNKLVQYAQPSTDAKPTLERMERVGLERGGPGDVDVLFWGDKFAIDDESELAQPPAPGGYYDRRAWMWYVEAYEYSANQSGEHFEYTDSDNATELNETMPPVVVTLGQNEGARVPQDGGERLHEWLLANGYERVSHQRYGNHDDAERTRPILFYFRTDTNESTNDDPLDGPRTFPGTDARPSPTEPSDERSSIDVTHHGDPVLTASIEVDAIASDARHADAFRAAAVRDAAESERRERPAASATARARPPQPSRAL